MHDREQDLWLYAFLVDQILVGFLLVYTHSCRCTGKLRNQNRLGSVESSSIFVNGLSPVNLANKNEFSFKRNENIHKKEDASYYVVSFTENGDI